MEDTLGSYCVVEIFYRSIDRSARLGCVWLGLAYIALGKAQGLSFMIFVPTSI